jgi:hypothetical protein
MTLRNNRVRAFTVVELMMSLAILTVGISGIIAMQKVTAMSNFHSKGLATATQIANSWQSQLLLDGTLWRNNTDLPPSTWLYQIGKYPDTWFRPSYDATRQFGPGFDALGNPVSDMTLAQFCVHLLLAPVTSTAMDNPGNAVIRATVRVFWPRAQASRPANFCLSDEIAKTGDDLSNYHFAYQTLAIRVNP